MNQDQLSVEQKRSRVRRWVTYAVIYGYLGLAGAVILWLMYEGKYEMAIGVLGGISGLAGSVAGFWFGSRRPESPVAGDSSSRSSPGTAGPLAGSA